MAEKDTSITFGKQLKKVEVGGFVTTKANEILKPVHDRMPVILKAADYNEWLDEKIKDSSRLENLLVPYSAKEIKSHPMSKSINIPDSDSAELIKPLNSL